MLDNILNSSVLVLFAGVFMAIATIAVQPEPRVESASDRNRLEGVATVIGRSGPTPEVRGAFQPTQPRSAASVGATAQK